MIPPSDPKPLSVIETTDTTPHAPLVWGVNNNNSALEDAERGFCEPECSDLPQGQHHPKCSQAIFGLNCTTYEQYRTDSDSESDELCHEFDLAGGWLEPPLLDELPSPAGQLGAVLAESFRRVLRVTKWPEPLGRRYTSANGISRAPFS